MPSRTRGRPQYGRLVFKAKRLVSVPDLGTIAEVARALGVARMSVKQWTEESGAQPLPCTLLNGRERIEKTALEKWLRETRRLAKE